MYPYSAAAFQQCCTLEGACQTAGGGAATVSHLTGTPCRKTLNAEVLSISTP